MNQPISILILGSVFPIVLHSRCIFNVSPCDIVTLVLQIGVQHSWIPSKISHYLKDVRGHLTQRLADNAREGKLVFIFPYVCMSSIQFFGLLL